MKLFVTVSAGFSVNGIGFSRGRGAKRPISRKLHENEMQWPSRGLVAGVSAQGGVCQDTHPL